MNRSYGFLLLLLSGLWGGFVFAADKAIKSQQQPVTEKEVAQQLAQIREMQEKLIQQQTNEKTHALNHAVPQQETRHAMPVEDVNEAAFASMATNLLPLSPEQVHKLKQMFNASQAAAAAPAGVPARPTATSQFVSLAPNSTPPVVRLGQGFISSVVFLDASGAHWPIESYSLGNPQAFNIAWNKKDNVLMIQASTLYTRANLAVRLHGLPTPVMVTLIPGQKAIDYRADLYVKSLGPNAKPMNHGPELPSANNDALLAVP